MATFQFEAMDSSGAEVKDRIDAVNEADAQRQLRARGYFVTRLKAVSGESVRNESRVAAPNPSDSKKNERVDRVPTAQSRDAPKGRDDPAQLLSKYGRIVERTESGGVRLRMQALARRFMMVFPFLTLLISGGFLSWMLFVFGKPTSPSDDIVFRVFFTLLYLAPTGIAGLGVVASVLQILWLLFVCEEWAAETNSLEVRRRLLGFSWGRQYKNGELLVEANYDRLGKSDAWRLAVKTDGQKHYLISERSISDSAGLASKRKEIEVIAALAGTVEASEDREQRGLPRAGGAHDGHVLAAAHRKVHALEHLDARLALAIPAAKPARFHDEIVHGFACASFGAAGFASGASTGTACAAPSVDSGL